MAENTALWRRGGGWLLESPQEIYCPEDFDDTIKTLAEITRTFVERDVLPVLDRMDQGELELNVPLIQKLGELGPLGAEIPEEYGGLDLPKVVGAVITEEMAPTGGFAVTYGAHTGIGTLPLVYWGTEEQKKKYLPKLASGEWIAAYALSEPGSGSDALGARTRATLSADGRHYLLNGTKQFISNSGFANLFTVFAKVDGEHFTAFLVERDFPGVSLGPEEKKMGIKASSTRQLILENAQVPVENVLGEIGKGHRIAFNILNFGRYKLGAGGVGAAKHALALSATYAKERRQFGRPIASFGAIQQKLAEMATRTYVTESAVYRTVGLIDEAIAGKTGTDAILAGIQEYAVECSILKVLGTETMDYAVDEGVQIHGGYGFLQDFPIERAYRDSRVQRIFEGTNEINRLLIPEMLFRRALKGELPLMEAAGRLQEELLEPDFDDPEGPWAREEAQVANLKKLALMIAGLAVQKFGTAIEEEQEVLLTIGDLLIDTYAAESGVARARKTGLPLWGDMARLYLDAMLGKALLAATGVLPRVAEGDDLSMYLSVARRLTRREPFDRIGVQREVAAAVLAAGGYPQPAASRAG
ncbi:acyl-CoA dehydrogenase family protein [Sphaerobacter thermophilus]|uniref:Acyl-CoA dehydrogenase domain protein n=1 Tax=Sphaerobacter thermophilus (strain ATCC 49802 / DSM 20745 / KCCM 41009 / NCIMB 13125 / S 6022) TaxID=479434 RepID=D1C935_SPHTD|nr:acyl-CoA dehydrogenase family protein [Sphaerobacter thermophilus]ACZ40328.1 acyl-CoA dehydrogenase domain protein [Sphaerobacter thermophilus DSM 20745]